MILNCVFTHRHLGSVDFAFVCLNTYRYIVLEKLPEDIWKTFEKILIARDDQNKDYLLLAT